MRQEVLQGYGGKSMRTNAFGLLLFSSIVTVNFTQANIAQANTTNSETHIQIIHTSDLHSHFTNSDSPKKMGGFARIKTKIDQLRQQNENALLLDSGDWSEGSIFYTLRSGEATQTLLMQMGYDAMVLGNHDWLVGPKEMYDAFVGANMKTPILSANLDLRKLPKDISIGKFIKPYITKQVAGKKIGIFGLSTFQFVFDAYFSPVKLLDPSTVAQAIVAALKNVEKCDAVILVSHLGIEDDKKVASKVHGIDLILGGHDHIITEDPVFVNGTPIVHVGAWGQKIGLYQLTLTSAKNTYFTGHQIIPITQDIPEDPAMKFAIEGYSKEIEQKMGNVFHDQIISSEVELPLTTGYTENALGNWATDAVRESAKADAAFDHMRFSSRQIYRGTSNTSEVFNLFPHIFSRYTQKAWTIHTFDVKGYALYLIMNALARAGEGIQISNTQVVYDATATNKAKVIKIGGKTVSTFSTYKIAGSNGIVDTLAFLKNQGVGLGISNYQDTGVEVWRKVADKLKTVTPITADKTHWQGRVRSLQPDLHIPVEQILTTTTEDGTPRIQFQVINAGFQDLQVPNITAKVLLESENLNDAEWVDLTVAPLPKTTLKGGESMLCNAFWPSGVNRRYFNTIVIHGDPVAGEWILDNNTAESTLNYLYLNSTQPAAANP